MRFSKLGTTAHALSMNVLDKVILVKGNYDGRDSKCSRHLPSPLERRDKYNNNLWKAGTVVSL